MRYGAAALAAGTSAHRASKVSIYDFRPVRGTEWDRTGSPIGIAFLMSHKRVTATKEHLHSTLEEAQALLFQFGAGIFSFVRAFDHSPVAMGVQSRSRRMSNVE